MDLVWFYPVLPDIHTRRTLEKFQPELWNTGDKVVKYFCLYRFIDGPFSGSGKAIYFKRKPLGGRLHLPDHLEKLVIDFRVIAKIVHGEIPENQQVDYLSVFSFFFADPFFFRIFLDFLVCTEADGVHIEEKLAFDAAASALPHPAPVLERFADHCARRNGSDGLVEVLYLDGGERYPNHISVATVFVHCIHVARSEHFVAG